MGNRPHNSFHNLGSIHKKIIIHMLYIRWGTANESSFFLEQFPLPHGVCVCVCVSPEDLQADSGLIF